MIVDVGSLMIIIQNSYVDVIYHSSGAYSLAERFILDTLIMILVGQQILLLQNLDWLLSY